MVLLAGSETRLCSSVRQIQPRRVRSLYLDGDQVTAFFLAAESPAVVTKDWQISSPNFYSRTRLGSRPCCNDCGSSDTGRSSGTRLGVHW